MDNPSTYQCHRESGWLPQVKLLGTYPLPWWGVQVSGTFQSQVPDPVGGANFDYNYFGLPANYVAGNAQVFPVARSQPVFGGERHGQRRRVRHALSRAHEPVRPAGWPRRSPSAAARLQGMIDFYNVFNSNNVLRQNGAYGTDGAAWARPQAIVPGTAGEVWRPVELLSGLTTCRHCLWSLSQSLVSGLWSGGCSHVDRAT